MHLDIKYHGEVIPIHVYSYFHGLSGRYSGPPEDCYPDEPAELEWEPESSDKDLNQYINDLPEKEKNHIEMLIWQQITDYEGHDDEPPDFDERYYDYD
jgi:hypothetical protein